MGGGRRGRDTWMCFVVQTWIGLAKTPCFSKFSYRPTFSDSSALMRQCWEADGVERLVSRVFEKVKKGKCCSNF